MKKHFYLYDNHNKVFNFFYFYHVIGDYLYSDLFLDNYNDIVMIYFSNLLLSDNDGNPNNFYIGLKIYYRYVDEDKLYELVSDVCYKDSIYFFSYNDLKIFKGKSFYLFDVQVDINYVYLDD